ncbi:hypothetical protein [Pedobacter nutrimenti]|uniref:hypothetical protein n=1 Tax=Pedobacter nutrimenti TaxID=1241337 RepID=UPI00292E0BCD|nr:hypothetical protein [Pedobacter nutrimenti]
MKTSWNELRLTEDYLLSRLPGQERVLFEARLILEPELKNDVYWQQKTCELVSTYGRQQLRKEVEQVHQQLFTAPEHTSFARRIRSFFNR